MNNNNRLFTLFLLLLAFPLALQAQVVTLTGKDFPQLLGKQNGLYSFFAMKEGRLAPVPHQWVEWSEQGYPFFEEDGSTDRIGDPRRIATCAHLQMRLHLKSVAGDGWPPRAFD